MEAGENLPILVLPGMDGTGELLRKFSARLSVSHDVQVVSYPTDQPHGYDELLAFVVNRLPNERFVIVAESFSGPIAIEIAATQKRVAGLILASSFAHHSMPSFLAPMARIVDLKWMPDSVIVAALLGTTGTSKIKIRLTEILARLPREVMQARISAALRIDKRNRLREINCPILCLHGRFDRLVGKAHVEEILSANPRCQIQWYDAAHMLLETQPDATAQTVVRFCKQLS